jgi:hypothetical protein
MLLVLHAGGDCCTVVNLHRVSVVAATLVKVRFDKWCCVCVLVLSGFDVFMLGSTCVVSLVSMLTEHH